MKAAIYIRVSTEEQSFEQQRDKLVKHAENEGYEYQLFNEKESTRRKRPVKDELYKRLLKKEFDVLLIYSISRWARSWKELATEIETLYERGVPTVILKEQIDLSTANGKLQFRVFAAFASFERELISERTKDAFYVGKDGKKYSYKHDKKVGRPKGSKDKKRRRKSGYYLRWQKDV